MIYTIFCDIDGVLIEQTGEPGSFTHSVRGEDVAIPKAAEKLMKWHIQRHRIILTTGRPECMRKVTEDLLRTEGMVYNQLIMDLGASPRILINDTDPRHPDIVKAKAIVLKRNEGIEGIDLG